ncbi:TPA: restriction endonuclease subunit S [Enterobacter hormaechei subsp. xiangfangensis]|uniref:restriction endonuclease subunit S n=1 Tax=Enterobacter hormaechei TaxID=158836 RepID=UPI000796FF90|nr:restriction endonuclease subunit S [Enterobacter hormaechei]HCJ7342053.1 restriction endonuclease subunit S [Enterobacter hormaechei subsp. xiangfangensis]MBJ6483804.1 restriction endonuclease subunit S [Enterobacter hormaechei]MBK4405765.1 restriction endonuclease subunit S [Enterobacter hormaechei]MCO7357769.1 restriction endonuclease subunit S [Enterobacter hormaechei]MDF7704057.1 restriction endonuclease subunit S [Enterobacter hormaechei subsp. steigerwaltii]
MMALKSIYPRYRTAKMRWLPSVPEHWNEQRAKTFFREVDERSKTGQEELLSVSHLTGVTPRSQKKVTMFKAESYVGSKLCRPGDIVINTLWAWMAALGTSKYAGIISPAYGVYRPYRVDTFNPRYLDYLLRTHAYVAEYIGRSTGIRSSRLRLYPNQFLDIVLLQPPRPEQDHIVDFLQAQDANIARFIKTKRDLIRLLTEQKMYIIDHAITRGIDISAELKPSDIEWLGKVPKHWKTLKLKFATKRIVGGSTPRSDEPWFWDGDIVWVTPRDISKTDYLYSSQRTISEAGLRSCSASLIPPGSIIITSRAPVGNVAIARVELCTNQGCKAIVPKSDIVISDFLYLLLLRMKERLQILANGTTFAEIGTSALANEFIPVPPISEQTHICQWINEECKPLNEAINRAEDEIRLIREFRDRQIADVVTGQVDVRNWVPSTDDIVTEEDLVALGEDEETNTDLESENGND